MGSKEHFTEYDDFSFEVGQGYLSRRVPYEVHVRNTKLHNANQRRSDRNEAMHQQRKQDRKMRKMHEGIQVPVRDAAGNVYRGIYMDPGYYEFQTES